jgi:diketogulonate reductase-like aldo/keto reductase
MPDEVPIVGQGTWQMAENRRDQDEIAALRTGITRGLTHIDTAEMYGSGRAEELVAAAIQGVPRRDLFIVSKVLPQNATRAGTLRACENSLRRLGTDYLDVYLLHWRGSVPLADTLGALEELVDQGKIRALGVSNFDVADLEEARALLRKHPIACNQVLYHLGERHIDADLVPYCARHDIAVVGYSPFGHGRFPSDRSAAGRALAAVAARHGATPRQVALAFLVREPPLFTIPKASTVAHAEENAGALDLVLDGRDVAEIDAAFPVRAASELPAL